MLCAIWYRLYNLKNVKNTHEGVMLLVKLQPSAYNIQRKLQSTYNTRNTNDMSFFKVKHTFLENSFSVLQLLNRANWTKKKC